MIKKELGEISGEGSLVEEYRKKIAAVKMPEQVLKEAERELDRLERTSEQQAEHGWIRTYLDWLCEIPWSERTEDRLAIQEAKRILDDDHTGLEDVKERVLEYLSVRKLRAERAMGPANGRGSGAILTLVGPPGVGKTSLGESVARALGRKFTRMSLGGVRDEAEIRGHRRTYVGQRWLRRHPRFHLHFVPTSASWLNLVEVWFAHLTTEQLRRGDFLSVRDLIDAIYAYIHHNQDAVPFIWTAPAERILEKVMKYRAISESLR